MKSVLHSGQPGHFGSRAARLLAFACAAMLALAAVARAAETKAAANPKADQEWQSLFDGKTLKGWRPTDFAGHGSVEVEKGRITIGMGEMLSGMTCTNPVPRMDYEVSLEAMKLDGSDFFCGLTFPVATNCCTLVLGGWGGAVVGISSLDYADASENETTQFVKFDNNRWYRVRVKVTKKRIEAWLDNDRIINVEIEGRKIDMRPGDIELCQPLGLATYQTSSAVRNLRLRKLDVSAPAEPAPKKK